jgi:2-iminobutanoate/2-iminopropanoate deaminase
VTDVVPVTASRSVVDAARAPDALGPYSHAIAARGFVFCSGQLPIDPSTGAIVGDGAGEQAEQCLSNLEAICAQAGTSLVNAARLTLFLTDLADFEEVNAVYAGFFDGSPPARVAVQAAALVGGARVEIDAIVVV